MGRDTSLVQNLQAPSSSSVLLQTHLVVGLDVPQPEQQLEAEQVVGADGLQLQQFAQSHQLRPLQVLQGQLVLKELGEADDLLRAGPVAAVPDLNKGTNANLSRITAGESLPPFLTLEFLSLMETGQRS